MDRPPPPRDDCRSHSTWTRRRTTTIRCIAAALVLACGVVVVLKEYSNPTPLGRFSSSRAAALDRSRLSEREQHVAKALPDKDGRGVGGDAVIASSGITDSPDTTHWMQDKEEEGLVKHYSSFVEYALESSTSGVAASLPLPVVNTAEKADLSIPIITIIGAQKGGTTNLRQNLLSHPMVGGRLKELDFFDRQPGYYPPVAQWEGEGLGNDIGVKAAGKILLEYAKACKIKSNANQRQESGTHVINRIIVDSSPEYMICPIVPYRIKMVRPGAKFIVVLRDPTDRYFSQVRMDMCRDNHIYSDFASMAEKINALFHLPGEAKDYLATGEEGYEPYTALCRGENASTTDLWDCYLAQKPSMPLYRGLYADQLERWFRVFDRSQIMVIDASDMLADFSAVVNAAATFAGLPDHDFKYDPSHEHKTGCAEYDLQHGHYFVEGGRYDTMFAEAGLFREWYRPHNERLYKLLDHDFKWQ